MDSSRQKSRFRIYPQQPQQATKKGSKFLNIESKYHQTMQDFPKLNSSEPQGPSLLMSGHATFQSHQKKTKENDWNDRLYLRSSMFKSQ
jgi:hypothetical protein